MGFFKKREKQAEEVAPDPGPTPERRQALETEIEELSAQLEGQDDPARIASLRDELGAKAQELSDIDAAIGHFEASLAAKEQFGPAYNSLLTLYNTKLKQSARAKDDAAIQEWTQKLDELMAVSKRVMRSNY